MKMIVSACAQIYRDRDRNHDRNLDRDCNRDRNSNRDRNRDLNRDRNHKLTQSTFLKKNFIHFFPFKLRSTTEQMPSLVYLCSKAPIKPDLFSCNIIGK
jgi:hypothetical protein